MGIEVIASGLKHAQTSLDAASTNMNSNDVRGYQTRSTVSEPVITSGKIAGFSTRTIRAANQFMEQQVRVARSRQQQAVIIEQYTQEINHYQTMDGNSVPGVVQDFLSQAKRVGDSPISPALQQEFVANADRMCSVMNGFSDKLNTVWSNADSDCARTAQRANEIMKNLCELNRDISQNPDTLSLFDQRDALLSDLAALMDVKVLYGSKGEVLVSLTSGVTIVNEFMYGMISYTTAPNASTLQQSPMPDVTIVNVDLRGTTVTSPLVIASAGSSPDVIQHGQLAGLIELRRDIIPGNIDQLNSLVQNFTWQINEIYSSGSGIPPKTTLQSAQTTMLSNSTTWGGKATIAALDSTGQYKALPDPANPGSTIPLKPFTFDFDKFQRTSGDGTIAISDIVDEVNAHFGGYTKPSLRLGAVRDIQLVGSSALQADGSLAFKMNLDNNSAFNVRFNVLGVQVYDNADALVAGGGLTSSLPDSFALEPGQQTITPESIVVQLPLGGVGNHNTIAVKMQILSDDGTLQEGWATFRINDPVAGMDLLNKRVYGASSVGPFPAQGNVAQDPAAITSNAPVVARLVDQYGAIIPSGNTTTPGYLAFDTLDGYSIVIDSGTSKELGANGVAATNKGFAHYFGFNQMFAQTPDGLVVNQALKDDPTTLSYSKLSQVPTLQQDVNVGAAKAQEVLTINAIPGVGDTITVHGVPFTFGPGPGQIPIGVSVNATATNIVTTLGAYNNATRPFRDLVTFSVVGNVVTCTAQVAGTGANGITVASSNILNAWGIGALGGGTNTTKSLPITNFAYQVGSGNKSIMQEIEGLLNNATQFVATSAVPATNTTLLSYVATCMSMISSAYSTAQTHSAVENGICERVIATAQKLLKPNIDDETMKAYQAQRLYSTLSQTLMFQRQNHDSLMRALAG